MDLTQLIREAEAAVFNTSDELSSQLDSIAQTSEASIQQLQTQQQNQNVDSLLNQIGLSVQRKRGK